MLIHNAWAAFAKDRGEPRRWPQRALALVRSRFLVAAALALGALVLTRLSLDPLAGAHFVPSLGAVCLAGLWGGTAPGLLALAICGVGYTLVAAADAAAAGVDLAHQLTRMGIFLAVGAAEAVGAGALRHAVAAKDLARARWEQREQRHRHVRLRLREQLDSLRSITGYLAEGLAALDPEGRLVFMNAAGTRMLGWDERELAGRKFHELVHPHHRSRAPVEREECQLLGALQHGRPVQRQDQYFTRSDGTEFPVSYTASAILRRGQIVGAALTFQDFSAHLRAEERERFITRATEALTESIAWEATLERVAQLAVPVLGDWCLVALDDERGLRSVAIVHADPARAAAARDFLERYPLDREAAHGVGRIVRTGKLEIVPEVDIDAFVVEGGGSASLRGEILRDIGLRSYMGVPLIARGRTLGAIAFAISEGSRRFGSADVELAEELAARCALAIDNARLYREAQEASRSREEVLAVVSHDLRAPLATVKLAAELVARLVPDDGPPELRRSADMVQRATGRAAQLVEDLVDAASLERGRLALTLEPHDVSALAREALAGVELLAQKRRVSLSLDAAPDAGAAVCDRHRVLQVLGNLLGNALKVTPGGGAIRLGVRRAEGEIVFSVADTGPGIAPEDQPRLFDRYWRGASSGYEGLGLGLAIVRGLIEAHGGHIGVRSAPGEGATFTFTLRAGPLAAAG